MILYQYIMYVTCMCIFFLYLYYICVYLCIYCATFSYNACITVLILLIMQFPITGRKSFCGLFGKQNGWIDEVPGCPSNFLLPQALSFYCWSYELNTFLICFWLYLLTDYQACIHEGSEPIQFFSIFQSFIVFKVWGILIHKLYFLQWILVLR